MLCAMSVWTWASAWAPVSGREGAFLCEAGVVLHCPQQRLTPLPGEQGEHQFCVAYGLAAGQGSPHLGSWPGAAGYWAVPIVRLLNTLQLRPVPCSLLLQWGGRWSGCEACCRSWLPNIRRQRR